ncbi:hypothetical protein, partial [Streptomyces sp. CBMA156]|uniref:hypothetical protein n=1 Tax=Streptomyces sp. CBMA156 TaxID=1930280 RepID=UPI001CB86561
MTSAAACGTRAPSAASASPTVDDQRQRAARGERPEVRDRPGLPGPDEGRRGDQRRRLRHPRTERRQRLADGPGVAAG